MNGKILVRRKEASWHFSRFSITGSPVKEVIGVGLSVATELPMHKETLQQTCNKLVKLQTHCRYQSLQYLLLHCVYLVAPEVT